MNNYLCTARENINNFSLDECEYIRYKNIKEDRLHLSGNGELFMKSELHKNTRVHINFMKSNGSKVFIGENLKGNIIIRISGDNSIVYLGDKNELSNLKIRSFQDGDLIATGKQVTARQDNIWISGDAAGTGNPALIIGDDCMLASNIKIRTSDGHPIFNKNGMQINCPESFVCIEPHVWVCDNAKILKDTLIGACSIVGLGSIVTRDAPRFSITTGIPGKSTIHEDIYWSRSDGPVAKAEAEYFFNKYKNEYKK